ncbi:MAG: hypothetical protein ACE5KE_14560 [Methanosarcinales archaeon]
MTIFKGRKLSEKEEETIKKFLEGKLEDMLENIDEFTDLRGDICITTRMELEDKLKEVI